MEERGKVRKEFILLISMIVISIALGKWVSLIESKKETAGRRDKEIKEDLREKMEAYFKAKYGREYEEKIIEDLKKDYEKYKSPK